MNHGYRIAAGILLYVLAIGIFADLKVAEYRQVREVAVERVIKVPSPERMILSITSYTAAKLTESAFFSYPLSYNFYVPQKCSNSRQIIVGPNGVEC